jgi:S1-C subfamily serine protease
MVSKKATRTGTVASARHRIAVMVKPASLSRATTALCCVSALAAGCGGNEQRSATPAGPRERLDLSVVGIGARIGHHEARSSGFVVDPDRGLVLTAAHAVWGARSLKLATAFGVMHGRIVARAPCDDLALLEVHPRIPGLAALPSAPGSAPTRDQLLRSVGRRQMDTGTTAAAIASLPVRVTAAPPAGTAGASLPTVGAPLDSPLVPEISGGPVVDEAGRLVGMAEAKGAPGVHAPAVAVPWTLIQQRLAQLKPGPRRVFVGWADQYRCVGRQHARARAAHPGFQPADARLNAPVAPTRLPGTEGLDG